MRQSNYCLHLFWLADKFQFHFKSIHTHYLVFILFSIFHSIKSVCHFESMNQMYLVHMQRLKYKTKIQIVNVFSSNKQWTNFAQTIRTIPEFNVHWFDICSKYFIWLFSCMAAEMFCGLCSVVFFSQFACMLPISKFRVNYNSK